MKNKLFFIITSFILLAGIIVSVIEYFLAKKQEGLNTVGTGSTPISPNSIILAYLAQNDDAKTNKINQLNSKVSDLESLPLSITTELNQVKSRIDILEYILIQVLTFTNSVNVVQKGSTVSSITFNFTFNKIPISISIDNGIGSITPTSAITKTASVNITANTTFTISVSDGQNTATRTTSIRFDNRMYFGSSASTTLTNAQILGLQNSVLVNARQRTVTLAGNAQHPVIAYPKSLGLPTFIMAGLENTDWTITEQSVTNSNNFTELYYVCVMNTIQNSSSIAINIQ